MRPAWLRFLCTGVIAYPALCIEYPRFRKIGDTAYRRERERELSRPEAMVARCPEAALWNRWSPFMTADRVRVPNQRNVRSLALHRHGQSHVAEPFTVRSLNPELDVDRLDGTVLPHARGRERERKRTRRRNLSFDQRGGSRPDSPLSPRGVLRLVPDSPNSTLLGNLPRTLPKREPGRGNAKCFGQ